MLTLLCAWTACLGQWEDRTPEARQGRPQEEERKRRRKSADLSFGYEAGFRFLSEAVK